MKIYTKSNMLSDFKRMTKSIMLGDTPATQYIWYDKKNKVAQVNTFDWWDGLNIEGLEVSPQYRGQGLSYQILDFAVKQLGVKNLAVKKDNKIAKHVYDKYGFKVVDEDKQYYYMSV